MKILHLDIETAPNICYTWGLFNQNIGINQIVEPGYTLCWAAKWHNNPTIMFDSVHKSGEQDMLKRMWELLDEADAVVHFNGTRFDIPTLNREFIKNSYTIPSPYKQIDLYRVVKSNFKFASNKLDWVSKELGIGAKVHHKGMSLWHDCMAGDKQSWKEMERYNKQDVRLLPKLYKKLLPWIKNHPNYALYDESTKVACPNCGSHALVRRGYAYSSTIKYRRYRCSSCSKWSRSRLSEMTKENRATILVGA